MQDTELIDRAVLGNIAEAWSRYPSQVPLQSSGDSEVIGQALGLFAKEGLVEVAGDSLALTASGYEAVQQAGRMDRRLSEFLRGASLAAEHFSCSSLLLAVLRAHFQLRTEPHR